jgi:hypothetical protein
MVEDQTCSFCMKTDIQLFKLKEWDKEGYRYYCQEHWFQVRQFQIKQMQSFLNYYSDPHKFNLLNKRQQELYSQLEQYKR